MLNEEKGNMEKSFHFPDTLFKSRFCYFGCIWDCEAQSWFKYKLVLRELPNLH